MSSSRRQNNGRSPLVNPQRQITSFFTKSTSPSPSPSPNLSKPKPKPKPKSNPNPSPSPSPSPSPTTPSPIQSKSKKPLLVIGQTPSPPPSTPGGEVVDKRIRVFWPLDKSWYEGIVKAFDKKSNKHLVQYDDAEEELLDLGKEKIEWVEESVKRFKRLRRGSLVLKKDLIEDKSDNDNENDNNDDGGDSSDEDWGSKNAEKEVIEDNEDDEEEVMDLDEDEEEESGKVAKQKQVVRKRKANGGGSLGSGKKSKLGGAVGKGGVKVFVMEPLKNNQSK